MLGLLYGAYMLLSGLSYIYTTRRGKFQVWAEFLSGLKLRGNEQILDLALWSWRVALDGCHLAARGQGTLASTSGKPLINQGMLFRLP